ncbi:hypothetical protein R1flu_000728 [Riccia fluitans]|uniref:Ribosomal protein S14 n=1 Tax=Riccia fluitans TaxID=41844 RepID=A0ABD1Y1F8_9MARC
MCPVSPTKRRDRVHRKAASITSRTNDGRHDARRRERQRDKSKICIGPELREEKRNLLKRFERREKKLSGGNYLQSRAHNKRRRGQTGGEKRRSGASGNLLWFFSE